MTSSKKWKTFSPELEEMVKSHLPVSHSPRSSRASRPDRKQLRRAVTGKALANSRHRLFGSPRWLLEGLIARHLASPGDFKMPSQTKASEAVLSSQENSQKTLPSVSNSSVSAPAGWESVSAPAATSSNHAVWWRKGAERTEGDQG